MGDDRCVICQEDFVETEQESERPAAYPCGHIIHRNCANQHHEYQSRLNYPKFFCPICKTTYQTLNEIRTLYLPSTGLCVRNVETMDPFVASAMSTDSQKETIEQLSDFQEFIMSWAMAVRDVNLQIVVQSGNKMRKLLPGLSGLDQYDWDVKFQQATGALEEILGVLKEEIISLNNIKEKHKRKLQRQTEKGEQLKKDEASLASKEEQLALKTKQFKEIENKIQESRVSLLSERSDLKRREKEMDRIIDECNSKVRQANIDADKAHKSANSKIKEIQEKTSLELDKMREAMEESQKLQKEAEGERDSIRSKNHSMANQLREFMNEIDTLKKSKKLSKERQELERSDHSEKYQELERENRRLKFRLEKFEKGLNSLSSKSKKPSGSLSKSSIPSSSPASSRLQSQSPSVFKAKRNRNNMDNSFSLSGPNDDSDSDLEIEGEPESFVSTTSTDLELSQQYGKRKRDPNDFDFDFTECSFVEAEDLDLELDDKDYPMPGMNAVSAGDKKSSTSENRLRSFKRVSSKDSNKSSRPIFSSKPATSNSSTSKPEEMKTHPFFKLPGTKSSSSNQTISSNHSPSSDSTVMNQEETRKQKEKENRDKLEQQLNLKKTLGLDKKGNQAAQVTGPKYRIRAYS